MCVSLNLRARAKDRGLPAAALLLLAAFAPGAQAQGAPPTLTGPITVTADEVDWNDEQRMDYRGNVKMTAEGFTLVGDQLQLEQRADGIFVRVDGQPARLDQDDARIDGRVSAQAQQLTYDAASQWIELTGDARLDRGKDRVEGRTIRYNVTARQVQARRAADDDDQVRIIIDNSRLRDGDDAMDDDPVPEPAETEADDAPAPESTP